jgi:hypothetical protein
MFGEKPYRFLPKLYEHYNNPKTDTLCKVLWLEVEYDGNRRPISSGEVSDIKIDSTEIEEQLESLGYK